MVDLIDNVNRTQTNPTVDRRTDYAGAQALERKIITDRNISDRVQQLRLRQIQNSLDNNRDIGQSIIREATLARAEQFARQFDDTNGLSRNAQNDDFLAIDDDNINNEQTETNIAQQAQRRLRALNDDNNQDRSNFIAEQLREETLNNQEGRFAFNNEGRFTAPNTRLGQLFDRFA